MRFDTDLNSNCAHCAPGENTSSSPAFSHRRVSVRATSTAPLLMPSALAQNEIRYRSELELRPLRSRREYLFQPGILPPARVRQGHLDCPALDAVGLGPE